MTSDTASTRAAKDICVVTHPLSSAGENATRTLLDVLDAITTVSLVTANLPEDSTIRKDHEVIEVSRRDEGTGILEAAIRFLVNQIRMSIVLARRDEEIVLFYGATSYVLPVLVAKLAGRTVVLEPRGDVPLTLRLQWERRIPDPVARQLAGSVGLLERIGYQLADAIVTYTPSMAEELGLDVYEEKTFTRGARYVDTSRFAPRIPYAERDAVVGFLGRLDEEKGIRTLASVAGRLPEGVRFRFIGEGDLEDWVNAELEAEIDAGTVELRGWVDHDRVPDELSELRLLIMPSQPTEGLPTTILEALACGTPVYATPVSGVPDVVRDGVTGFHMDELAAAGIAADVGSILERDDLETISRNGRELIEQEYSFEAAVDRYRRILAEL